jgi:transposase
VAGVDVAYGYKGKGILIHSITDANGMPVVAITTPANGDERQQVLTMLAQIRLATLKRGNPKRRPKTLAADIGYDANWLRKKLRTKGIRPQSKKRHLRGKKPKGRPMRGSCTPLPARAVFLLVSTQVSTTRCSMGMPKSMF